MAFTTKHNKATVTISQVENDMYLCTINWTDGDISACTANTMIEVNRFLLSYNLDS